MGRQLKSRAEAAMKRITAMVTQEARSRREGGEERKVEAVAEEREEMVGPPWRSRGLVSRGLDLALVVGLLAIFALWAREKVEGAREE